MKQTFECVEKHLYRRQYQTAGGDWSRAVLRHLFTDGKRNAGRFRLDRISRPLGRNARFLKRGISGRRLRYKGRFGAARAPYDRKVFIRFSPNEKGDEVIWLLEELRLSS